MTSLFLGQQQQGEKNRWPCPSCTAINTMENLNCHVCMKPKPGRKIDLQAEQDKHAPTTGVVKRPWTQRIKSIFVKEPLKWTCPNCTLENGGYYTKCTACGFLKEEEQPKKKRRTSNGDWQIPVLSSLSTLFRGKDTNSTVVPPRDSGPRWKCPTCTLEENPDSANVCSACGSPKPTVMEELDINGDTVELHCLDKPFSDISHDSGLESLPERTTPRHMSDDSSHQSSNCHSTNHQKRLSLSNPHSKTVKRLGTDSGVFYDPTSPHYPSMPAFQESPGEHVPFSSMVSERPTWKCTICGAYNLQKLPKCFVCGIGNNPMPAPQSSKSPPPLPGPHMANHIDQLKIKNSEIQSSDQDSTGSDKLRHCSENKVRNGFFHRLDSNSNSLTEISHRNNRTTLILEQRQQAELEASINFEAIRKYCKEHHEPFTDPDFPPADKSLYTDPTKPVKHWKVAQWLRPRNVSDPSASFLTKWEVFRNPRPEDMTQGVLGNCWVLSALSVIAEQPTLIQEILLTKKYSTVEGAYQVRLCKDGKWQVVVVDDCLPCYKNKQLVFSKALRKQLWVPLIEKALAKLYGSYEALNAGRVLSGLSILTGLPCEKIYLQKQSLNDVEVDYDIIWAQMLSFREQGFPMGASCGGYNIDEEEYYKTGLEPNHAYSILDIRQLDNLDESYRLIRLRNPWGKYSWKGAWSDRDQRWNPWLKDQLQAMGAEAGIFWMDFHDFYRYFCEVDVCKYRPDWYSTRIDGKLLPYVPRQQRILAFEVITATEVDISLYQPSLRGGPASQNLVDLAMLVMRYPAASDISDNVDPESIPLPISCAIASGSHIHSVVTSTGFLEPGRYVVLPLSFSHCQHPSAKFREHSPSSCDFSDESFKPYVVALFCAKNLYHDCVLTRPGFMTESLFVLAQDHGTVSEPFPKMRLHEVYLKHSCRILVAVNEDPQCHFTVTCDGMQSANVLSSRGELYTVDCIPPMHRQVVLVLTQLEATQPYSVLMRIEFNKSQHNSEGAWGALHLPSLHPGITELHSPRLI